MKLFKNHPNGVDCNDFLFYLQKYHLLKLFNILVITKDDPWMFLKISVAITLYSMYFVYLILNYVILNKDRDYFFQMNKKNFNPFQNDLIN